MHRSWKLLLGLSSFLLIALTCVTGSHAQTDKFASATDKASIEQDIAQYGQADVIVDLDIPVMPGILPEDPQALQATRQTIDSFLSSLGAGGAAPTYLLLSGSVAIEVNSQLLSQLMTDSRVKRLTYNRTLRIQQDETPEFGSIASNLGVTVRKVEAEASYGRYGAGGQNFAVAVVDSGVATSHSAFVGKAIGGFCFSRATSRYSSTCPNGGPVEAGIAAAQPCSMMPDCAHGTGVASVAAGLRISPRWPGPSTAAVTDFLGTAPLAFLYPVQVMSVDTRTSELVAQVADLRAALQHIYINRNALPNAPIAAVNVSLNSEGARSPDDCDADPLADDVRLLKTAGIVTVISAGNQADKDALAWPACISDAVVVASVDLQDKPSSFSNFGPLVDLFAPGEQVDVASPGDSTFSVSQGTSFAAPHVTGAVAALRSHGVAANVDALAGLLRDNGTPIEVGRERRPRINVLNAIAAAKPSWIFVTPQYLKLTFCDGCSPRQQLALFVSKGNASWKVVAAPTWLTMSGLSGVAPNTISLIAGSDFAQQPPGTAGIIRIKNMTQSQPDIVVQVEKITAATPRPVEFRLEKQLEGGALVPGARTIYSEVTVTEDGHLADSSIEFPNDRLLTTGLRVLRGNAKEVWRFENLPPWLSADPNGGRVEWGVTPVRFHVGAESELAKLAPGKGHRANFAIVDTNDQSKRIELTSIIQVSRPPTSHFLLADPGNGVLFTGTWGGPFEPAASSMLKIEREGGDVRWEIFDLPTWLTVDARSGSAPSQVTFSTTKAAESLLPGEYATNVIIVNRSGYQPPSMVTVRLAVRP